MEHTHFRKAAQELRMAANALPGVVEGYIGQYKGTLEQDKDTNDETPEQIAELILRQIAKRIEDVMACFDSTLESVNMPQRYSSFFLSLNLTDEDRKQFRRALDEHGDESA